jgi:MFS family permease
MGTVLRRRDFRLLFIGQSASLFGDSVLLLGLAIWVKTLTGSNGLAGVTILAMAAPSVLAPALGAVVDRFRRRPFLIVANLASAAALSPLFLVHARRDVWLVYAVGVLYGVSFVVLSAALNGLLKELLPDGSLAQANGLLAMVKQGARLLGPLGGAGLFAAFGPVPMVLIDLLSFLLAAGAMGAIALRETAPARTAARWREQIADGSRQLWRDRPLRHTTIAVAIATLSFGALESIIFAYVDRGLHRPPTFLGVLGTMQGVGGLLGGVFAARLIRRVGEVATVGLGIAAFGVSCLLLTYPSLALAAVAMPMLGAALSLSIVGLVTLTQRRTPAALMGRVSTTVDMLTTGPMAVSIGLGAVLVSLVDYRLLCAVIGLVMLVDGLLLARLPADQGEVLLELDDARVGQG